MATFPSFQISNNSDGSPLSAFAERMTAKKIRVLTSEFAHPCRNISNAGSKLERSVKSFCDRLHESDKYNFEEEGSTSDVLSALEDLTYCAVEMFDVYAQIPKQIDLKPEKKFEIYARDYARIISERRRLWALICNRIKHNHNVLVPERHRQVSNGIVVRSFSLYEPDGSEGLKLNKEVHRNQEESIPFDIAGRQILYDLFYCDYVAAVTIDRLPDTEVSSSGKGDVAFVMGRHMKSLADRAALYGAGQQSVFGGFNYADDEVSFREMNAERLRGKVEQVTVFRGDGYTKSFKLGHE